VKSNSKINLGQVVTAALKFGLLHTGPIKFELYRKAP